MKKLADLVVGVMSLAAVVSPAAQMNYPEKPIRLVVGFPPGQQTDVVGRLLGLKLAESMGKPIVIDNAPGAAGNIAADRVAR